MTATVIGLTLAAAAAIIGWVSLRWYVGALPPGPEEAKRKERYRWWLRAVEFATLGIVLIAAGAWAQWYLGATRNSVPTGLEPPPVSAAEEAELRRVVRESQLFEHFTLYRNPEKFQADMLKKFWLPAAAGGREIIKVEEAISNLTRRGYRYGPESQAEQFATMAVRRIDADTARVETRERWFLPLYDKSGRRVPGRNAYFGPYDVVYTLRQADGQWLIADSTTPRAK